MIKFKKDTTKYISMIIFAFMSNIVIVMFENHFYSIFGIIYGTILSPIFVIIYSLTLFLFPIKSVMNFIDMIFVKTLVLFSYTNIRVPVPNFSIK